MARRSATTSFYCFFLSPGTVTTRSCSIRLPSQTSGNSFLECMYTSPGVRPEFSVSNYLVHALSPSFICPHSSLTLLADTTPRRYYYGRLIPTWYLCCLSSPLSGVLQIYPASRLHLSSVSNTHRTLVCSIPPIMDLASPIPRPQQRNHTRRPRSLRTHRSRRPQ
jgi:hypothetical protein